MHAPQDRRHGVKTLQGKHAFDAEIENDAFEGRPTLTSRLETYQVNLS